MEVRLIGITHYIGGDGTTEGLIEHAGRVCYRSEAQGDAGKFIRARLAAGHESIIEHASATFEISGISRACSHQLVRHRLASYSMESQRYVDMSEPTYIIPPEIEMNPEAALVWHETMDEIRLAYQALRELGISKEDARFVLPTATATRIVMTMNFRELRHFLRVRLEPSAQWEIRAVAQEIERIMVREAPSVFLGL